MELQQLFNAAYQLAVSVQPHDPLPVLCLPARKVERILKGPTHLGGLLETVSANKAEAAASVRATPSNSCQLG